MNTSQTVPAAPMKSIDPDDSFKTVARTSSNEIEVKGSRFIAYIFPAETEETAFSHLHKLRSKYPDATHHCNAFIIGMGAKKITRFNDDGEPSGTAGRPILGVLEGSGLTNILCIVVRYFGGTKLGAGGLVRAYSDAARQALEDNKVITSYITEKIGLKFPYDMTGTIERFVIDYPAIILERRFGSNALIYCTVRQSKVTDFINHFTNLSKGKGMVLDTERN